METAIRKGQIPFYAHDIFPYGLSRSSYFNKRESEELITYGQTFFELHNGLLSPENEEEAAFVSELNSNQPSSLYAVKLWQKYLAAVSKRGTFHGFSMSSRFIENHEVVSSNDDDDDLEFAS